MEIITILILVLLVIYLGAGLLKSHKEKMGIIEKNARDRENWILLHFDTAENIRREYDEERKVLTDKLLKRNGISPIHEERKEPKPFVIESNLTKNARIKRESEDRPNVRARNGKE